MRRQLQAPQCACEPAFGSLVLAHIHTCSSTPPLCAVCCCCPRCCALQNPRLPPSLLPAPAPRVSTAVGCRCLCACGAACLCNTHGHASLHPMTCACADVLPSHARAGGTGAVQEHPVAPQRSLGPPRQRRLRRGRERQRHAADAAIRGRHGAWCSKGRGQRHAAAAVASTRRRAGCKPACSGATRAAAATCSRCASGAATDAAIARTRTTAENARARAGHARTCARDPGCALGTGALARDACACPGDTRTGA